MEDTAAASEVSAGNKRRKGKGGSSSKEVVGVEQMAVEPAPSVQLGAGSDAVDDAPPPPPPLPWKRPTVAKIEVNVRLGDGATEWQSAKVKVIVCDGKFEAQIGAGKEAWTAVFTWQQEGRDWRRRFTWSGKQKQVRTMVEARIALDDGFRPLVQSKDIREVLAARQHRPPIPAGYLGEKPSEIEEAIAAGAKARYRGASEATLTAAKAAGATVSYCGSNAAAATAALEAGGNATYRGANSAAARRPRRAGRRRTGPTRRRRGGARGGRERSLPRRPRWCSAAGAVPGDARRRAVLGRAPYRAPTGGG